MNENNNRKFFGVTLNAQKSFSLVIYDIKQILTWFFSSNNKISILLQKISENGRLIALIRLKSRIFYVIRALNRLIFTTNLRLRTTYIFKLLIRLISTIKVYYRISPTFRFLFRCFVPIMKIPRIIINATPSIAQYIMLLVHDPYTLANRDVLTLYQMDQT